MAFDSNYQREVAFFIIKVIATLIYAIDFVIPIINLIFEVGFVFKLFITSLNQLLDTMNHILMTEVRVVPTGQRVRLVFCVIL